jgi:hypothetical protein
MRLLLSKGPCRAGWIGSQIREPEGTCEPRHAFSRPSDACRHGVAPNQLFTSCSAGGDGGRKPRLFPTTDPVPVDPIPRLSRELVEAPHGTPSVSLDLFDRDKRPIEPHVAGRRLWRFRQELSSTKVFHRLYPPAPKRQRVRTAAAQVLLELFRPHRSVREASDEVSG